MLYLLSIVLLLVLGAYAAAPLWASKCEKSTACLAKVAPYHGWLGLVAIVDGAIMCIFFLGILVALDGMLLVPFLMLFDGLLLIALGILAGHTILATRIFANNPAMVARLGRWNAALLPHQVKLGVAAGVLGVILLLLMLL